MAEIPSVSKYIASSIVYGVKSESINSSKITDCVVNIFKKAGKRSVDKEDAPNPRIRCLGNLGAHALKAILKPAAAIVFLLPSIVIGWPTAIVSGVKQGAVIDTFQDELKSTALIGLGVVITPTIETIRASRAFLGIIKPDLYYRFNDEVKISTE